MARKFPLLITITEVTPDLPAKTDFMSDVLFVANSKIKEMAFIIQKYIETRNKKCPLTALDFINASRDSEVAIDLILAQAVQESNLGDPTKSKRSVRTKNMFNVGNTDEGRNRYFDSWKTGLDTYVKLLANRYGKTFEEVEATGFRVTNGPLKGKRYASDLNYVSEVRAIVKSLRRRGIKDFLK